MLIAVVDGQGGGIGRSIVGKIKSEFPDYKVIALGTNSVATGQMLKAGADEGATGENAITFNMNKVDIVCGVVAVINANSMHGELTPKIAESIGSSPAYKILLPVNRCNIDIVSVKDIPIAQHIDNLVAEIRKFAETGTRCSE